MTVGLLINLGGRGRGRQHGRLTVLLAFNVSMLPPDLNQWRDVPDAEAEPPAPLMPPVNLLDARRWLLQAEPHQWHPSGLPRASDSRVQEPSYGNCCIGTPDALMAKFASAFFCIFSFSSAFFFDVSSVLTCIACCLYLGIVLAHIGHLSILQSFDRTASRTSVVVAKASFAFCILRFFTCSRILPVIFPCFEGGAWASRSAL